MKNLVVCINDGWFIKPELPHPVKGEIYTVDGIVDYGVSRGGEGLLLVGFDWTVHDSRIAFAPDHFRPVDSTYGEVVAEIIEKQLELETA